MRIAHFGTFDVENYGDLLFPIVARSFLAELEAEFEWISPKGGAPVCADAVASTGVLDLPWREWSFDLALIGGGNIVTPRPTDLPAYGEPKHLASIAYPTLWLSACLKAAECKAVIAWDAPGTMAKGWSAGAGAALNGCLGLSDYVALRETEGLDWLDEPVRRTIRSVPDTVVALPRVWPKASLAPEGDAIRREFGLEAPYFIVHLKGRNVPTPQLRKAAAAAIDRLAEATGLMPVLLPIGRCHGDAEALSLVQEQLASPAILIVRSTGLRETTALIAQADYVFSASLHCALVAAAYGAPVHALSFGALLKHRAFFETHLGIDGIVVDSFEDRLNAPAMAEAVARRQAVLDAVDRAADAVEAHFEAIRTVARAPRTGKQAERRELLAAIDRAIPPAPYLPLGALIG
jgi:hypothetical protein